MHAARLQGGRGYGMDDSGRTPCDWPYRAPLARLNPVAQTAVQHYVSEVAELGLDVQYHGVWCQSEAGILAYHQGTVPMPAASLTKVATTLAALRAWGPTYQFVTLARYHRADSGRHIARGLDCAGWRRPVFCH